MSSCTCILQFLIYYRNVTCELEVGNLSWIESDSLGQWRAHCSMSWSRGWVGHAGQMVNISLKPFIDVQMMEHTWHRATHSIRHLLQPWKFCSTKVRQWCYDLNEIRKILHLDFLRSHPSQGWYKVPFK